MVLVMMTSGEKAKLLPAAGLAADTETSVECLEGKHPYIGFEEGKSRAHSLREFDNRSQ